MKALDFEYDDRPRPARNFSVVIWNLLTAIILLSVFCVAGFFLMIFINPYSGFNPFPPPTMPAAILLPSLTPTPRNILPPTWTPSPTLEPTATSTPRPTATLPPTETPFYLFTPQPGTPSQTPVVNSEMPFILQKDTPLAIANIYHPDKGCSWMGVGGQVFDMKGSALRGLQVQLGGAISGTPIPEGYPTLTGLLPYAPGYYEFTLAEKPIASEEQLWVQLVDQAGLPMSDKVHFDTFEDCEKNLVIINFKQVR